MKQFKNLIKDGVEVTGDDYERIDEGCVHILQIKQVGAEHAGRYQCELVKSGDKTYCNVAVEDSPFQSDPVTKSIFVGESAEFEVMVKDNASKVIWSVNGKTGESRFEDSESGFTRKFKVSAAELSDNGPIVAVVEAVNPSQSPATSTSTIIWSSPRNQKTGPAKKRPKSPWLLKLTRTPRLPGTTTSVPSAQMMRNTLWPQPSY